MDYDTKFEEMKKYIPFLEGMIHKLSLTSGSNPRQAQLDKIKSLRDLLMDKKKRMKMENLLKCEQVLVNLYAKVEQRDTLPGIIPGPNASRSPVPPEPPDISELDVVRTKLKIVAMADETLPEIARRSETEETCTAGSKEPALFQRRPNVNRSPSRDINAIEKTDKPKRNYTRVLVSPEPSERHWQRESSEGTLYSRRSPRRSTVKSPKKDKAKYAKKGKSRSDNLNITLNVPQETLDTLSTEDLVSRIITCNDNDVDIDTLRDLRKQILGELKHTGANEDISDFILKSYKKKPSQKKKGSKKEVEEGEISDSESEAIKRVYGSLVLVDKEKRTSDESTVSSEPTEKQPRKIQISLVINNPETEALKSSDKDVSKNDNADFVMFDGETSHTAGEQKKAQDVNPTVISKTTLKSNESKSKLEKTGNEVMEIIALDDDENVKTITKTTVIPEKSKDLENSDDEVSFVGCSTVDEKFLLETLEGKPSRPKKSFKPNFYNEQKNTDDNIQENLSQHNSDSRTTGANNDTKKIQLSHGSTQLIDVAAKKESQNTKPKSDEIPTDKIVSKLNDKSKTKVNPESVRSKDIRESQKTKQKPDEISTEKLTSKPTDKSKLSDGTKTTNKSKLTDKTKPSDKTDSTIKTKSNDKTKPTDTSTAKTKPSEAKVSEIDILQALKNDILSETITIPGAEPTPALHQPKISKVVNAEKITKRTISIEKYKQKAVPAKVTSLFSKDPKQHILSSEEQARKQSLKLTEKECERFQFPTKLALDDSCEEDDVCSATMDDIYGDLGPVSPDDDLAPRSPEHEEFSSSNSPAPIIIPAEPISLQSVAISNSDIDMRILSSPNVITGGPSTFSRDLQTDNAKNPASRLPEPPKIPPLLTTPLLTDPRLRRDMSRSSTQNSPNPYAHPERTPRHGNFPNMTPSRTPLLQTPIYTAFDNEGPGNYPNMTPSRTPNMSTPSYAQFDIEDDKSTRKHVYAPIGNFNRSDREQSVIKEHVGPHWEPNDARSDHRRPGLEHPEGRSFDDKHARNSSVHRDVAPDYQKARYGPDAYDPRNDRYLRDKRDSLLDCPRTPVHPFGRTDGPMQSPMFGRNEAPRTPVHPFGRPDVRTSNHPYGQSDGSSTPGPSFGRSDAPLTPLPSFGRSEVPLTPGSSFGRSDPPLTPGPSFGRYDAPLTPGPSFGRSDGSMTPSHPYSRSEYSRTDTPITPVHHFGRSDAALTPSRYDHSQNHNYVKDPRLNRSTEHDCRSRRFERNADCFDRQQSESNRGHNYGRERSVGRFEQSDGSSYRDHSVGHGMEKQSDFNSSYDRQRRGPSAKRDFVPNDDRGYKDYGHKRDFNRCQSVGRSDNRRTERALSVNRDYKKTNTLSVEAQSGRSFLIDTSVNSTFQQFLNEKGLKEFGFSFDDRRKRASSVGRFLSTDTGVKNQRQDSVGPSRRDSNTVDKRDGYHSKSSQLTPTKDYKIMVNFVRARSMGRELSPIKKSKSFAEVKDDLKSFSANTKPQHYKRGQSSERKMNYRDPRSRPNTKLQPEKKSVKNLKSSYSPRKNNRDPRMQREKSSDRYKHKADNRKVYDYGISYSNDNLARGSLLNPAYGVKNYKIPKIKKAPEPEQLKPISTSKDDKLVKNKEVMKDEKIPANKIDKNICEDKKGKKIAADKVDKNMSMDKVAKNVSVVLERAKVPLPSEIKEKPSNKGKYSIKEKTSIKDKSSIKEKSSTKEKSLKDPEGETSRRTTRATSRRRSICLDTKNSDDEVVPIQRKTKKAVIKSDSEEPDEVIKGSESIVEKRNTKAECDKMPLSTKAAKSIDEFNDLNENDDDDLFDGSFTIEDLDVASEHISEKSLIENINSLIDDLDNDLNSSSTLQEVPSESNTVLEETAGKIKSVNDDECKSEVINRDLLTKTISSDQTSVHVSNTEIVPVEYKKVDMITKDVQVEKVLVSPIKQADVAATNSNLNREKIISEEPELDQHTDLIITDKRHSTVTTTDCENDSPALESKLELVQPINEKQTERCSTPDSTINSTDPVDVVESKSKDIVYPCTNSNESANEMNPQVTSTHDHQEGCSKTSDSETTRPTTQIESIGNLLSILQDKSKIKELLSMLDQSSETEKLKKKLEKLSEIVSDEDDEGNAKIDDDAIEKKTCTIHASDESEVKPETKSVSETRSEPELTRTDKTTDKIPDESATKNSKIAADTELEDSKMTSPELEDSKMTSPTEAGFEDTQVNKLSETALEESKVANQTVNKNPTQLQEPKVGKKVLKKGKGKTKNKKVLPSKAKRMTRSEAAKPKASRELKQLQESIKEMLIKDDIMNATGIRMCRLAKLVDEKRTEKDGDSNNTVPKEILPVVVLQKFKDETVKDGLPLKIRKKPGPKPKSKVAVTESSQEQGKKSKKGKIGPKHKPNPKTKENSVSEEDDDPYAFETDSVSDITTSQSYGSSTLQQSSDSENESLASSKSFGSSEVLADLKKKPKRKRRLGWKLGVIAKRKKKNDTKLTDRTESPTEYEPGGVDSSGKAIIPDKNCFTDPTYCFRKSTTVYSCRLCEHTCSDIVHHYKKQHPHSEIPLSRLSPTVASKAINQSAYVDFQAISRVSSDKYVCRFCFKEFVNKKSTALETFFWHVVSMHTGEYKQLCPECLNVTRCPFNLDIPPPPKEVKGQLIGYICEKCNFTQISLENLKTHVTVRHNDEQTSVCTINLADMNAMTLQKLTKKSQLVQKVPRTLRSSNQSSAGISDDHTDISESTGNTSDKDSTKQDTMTEPLKNRVAKLTFEEESDTEFGKPSVKLERDETFDNETAITEKVNLNSDVCDYPHFKVWFAESGTKEYVCCVNKQVNHYRTSLLISMKRHIQTKHTEIWDGYCFICKVIVTSQGQHIFKECFQHYVDMHMDNFPRLEASEIQDGTNKTSSTSDINKSAISVHPIKPPSVTPTCVTAENTEEPLPTTEKVVGNPPTYHLTQESSIPDSPRTEERGALLPPTIKKIYTVPEEIHKYEEVQAEVMYKKHHVVLQNMMSKESLVRTYKCAGRYCSFASDSAEAAWSHASTHQRFGGENALVCTYCDFDCKGNASDLVTHVFKIHGSCQFACSVCFYRAAASRLVQSHIVRVHAQTWSQVKVLESTTPKYMPKDHVVPLSRELAVKSYTCVNDEANCKYKTFILEKFNEHMTKHAAPYVCSICSISVSTVSDLSQHAKTHGLNMYQCTWCVHGADNEAELLAHASARHPARQPQAYVRTVKQLDAKQMVLPLAKFNKSNVQTEVIKTSSQSEDPVREAERSIDLEKLIGSVTESAPTTEPQNEIATEIDEDNSYEVAPPSPCNLEPELNIPEPELNIPEPPNTPTPPNTDESLDSRTTPVLKTERVDDSPVREIPIVQEIINLDSDDDTPPEDTSEKVIGISEESRTSHQKHGQFDKISLVSLFKCPRCYTTCKTRTAFKRHINSCYNVLVSKVRCAHCPLETDTKELLYIHYTCDHGNANREVEIHLLNKKEARQARRSNEVTQLTPIVNVYICDVCQYRDTALSAVKNHMRSQHKITVLTIAHKYGKNDKDFEYTVRESSTPTKKSSTQKRKLSSGSAEPVQKRIRYSLQDLKKLPVKPILDDLAYCAECEFSTKVRLNLVRHLQQHADNSHVVPSTVPLNPVPHLETNEKHFDKMVNLASSSSETIRLEKQAGKSTRTENVEHIPPEAASRYPKYVPDRQRHTCGAKGCSYISVDQAMLKRHWEALHVGSNDYHCVHCPPYQELDTSTTLTAARILAHLKMHDSNMYACSSCPYYHHKRNMVEKHLNENHKGTGKLLIVREENSLAPVAVPSISQAPTSGPTMDLKPYQCGLCKFKSLMRPEVIEHCFKQHNTKMQFKCPNCPFRASTLDNVSKHKTKSHPNSTEDVIFYYYREGSIPDDPDGTPRWQRQRQKMGIPDTEVKVEESQTVAEPLAPILLTHLLGPPVVDLNKVKKENPDPVIELSVDELYAKYGAHCEPTGLKYKCPLCKVFTEDNKEVMQSHLFEELKYRKWGCSVCSYKAFHKKGLTEHMFLEHHQRTAAPILLPVDENLEKWVTKLLDSQTKTIEMQKDAISKQKAQIAPPASCSATKTVLLDINEEQVKNLEQAFGQLGASKDSFFCCPKCDYQSKDEAAFKDHLEIELNKIRWRCSRCPNASQTYHEAQLHCKTCNYGSASGIARPVEAVRDPALRTTWVNTAIRLQKKSMNIPEDSQMIPDDMTPTPGHLDLLVVRYEESVPTPEEEMLNNRKRALTPLPSTSAAPDPESDDERLIIDDTKTQEHKATGDANVNRCPYCDHTSKYAQSLRLHVYRHFNLKAMTCDYCPFQCDMKTKSKVAHTEKAHPGMEVSFRKTPIPKDSVLNTNLRSLLKPQSRKRSASALDAEESNDKAEEEATDICLVCEKYVAERAKESHPHNNTYAVKGQIVVKCCTCLSLFKNHTALQEHHTAEHSNVAMNYAYFKLHYDTREILVCSHCNKHFKFKRDLKAHNDVVHGGSPLKYETKPYSHEAHEVLDITDDDITDDSTNSKKSTTKKSHIAKKSTSKLPYFAQNENSRDSDCVDDNSEIVTKIIPDREMP